MKASEIQLRFVDRGRHLFSFAWDSPVMSVCPKCRNPAFVTFSSKSVFPDWIKDSRVSCSKCAFELRPLHQQWLGPVIGTANSVCPNCGFKWLEGKVYRGALTIRTRRWLPIACPACEQVCKAPLKWTVQRLGSPIDPAFGLPLFLQISCCGETLWAFNREHLTKLREYVSASLRERTGVLGYSVFNRLPKWVSAARNRDAVLTGLARLEDKLNAMVG